MEASEVDDRGPSRRRREPPPTRRRRPPPPREPAGDAFKRRALALPDRGRRHRPVALRASAGAWTRARSAHSRTTCATSTRSSPRRLSSRTSSSRGSAIRATRPLSSSRRNSARAAGPPRSFWTEPRNSITPTTSQMRRPTWSLLSSSDGTASRPWSSRPRRRWATRAHEKRRGRSRPTCASSSPPTCSMPGAPLRSWTCLQNRNSKARCRHRTSCPSRSTCGSTTSRSTPFFRRSRGRPARQATRRAARRSRPSRFAPDNIPLTPDTLNTAEQVPTALEVGVLNGGTTEETDVVVSFELLGSTEPIEGEDHDRPDRSRHARDRGHPGQGEIPEEDDLTLIVTVYSVPGRVDRGKQRAHLPGPLRRLDRACSRSPSPFSGPPEPSRTTRCARRVSVPLPESSRSPR